MPRISLKVQMFFLLAAGQGANSPKSGSIKDIVKQTSSGTKQSSEAEDQVVMETKLKIIEILQVSVSLLKHLNSRETASIVNKQVGGLNSSLCRIVNDVTEVFSLIILIF